MLLEHVYNETGYFVVTVNTNNLVSYNTFQTSIRITATTCFRPVVAIMSVSADYHHPTIVNCGDDTALNARVCEEYSPNAHANRLFSRST
jgi:hypothetical protein